MILKSFTVENLKAFGAKQSAEFAQPSSGTSGSGLTVFVGPNNSGKSTILRALRSITSDDVTFTAGAEDRRRGLPVGFQLLGRGGDHQDFDISLESRIEAAHLKKVGWNTGIGKSLKFIPARRPWNDRFQPGGGLPDHELVLFSNLRTNEFYVDSEFGRAMVKIETDPVRKKYYTDLLVGLDPSITNWTIDNSGQDYISFESAGGYFHRVGLVGEGVNNLFRIAYALFEFKEGDVLLLDEPELSLHPQGQKRLYEAIRTRAGIGQIVLSTHSPYFVSWADIQNGAKIFRISVPKGGSATIRTIKPETLKRVAAVANEKKNRKLYDVVAKEVFFSVGCLFVEGQEDAHVIASYLEETAKPAIEIFGYGSGGASHICSWLSFANDLDIKAAALFDGDEAGRIAHAEATKLFGKNPKILLLILRTDDIRDKPKESKEGIFDESWKLKPLHKTAWNELLDEATSFLNHTEMATVD
jgi:predicted ATP-dependent endonuclease of OLD family